MRTLAFVVLSLACTWVKAEFKEPKFGKVTSEELTMKQYDKDTTADAVILFDNGSSRFGMSQSRQFNYTFERHYRIKIFKKAAFDIASLEIILHRSGSRKETLSSLKAATYNIDNGKMVTTKLEKSNIFEEESKYRIKKKFALPDVKEGSIIEVSYAITSDFLYDFKGWEFQYQYPAVWSQYSVIFPEYFMYRQSSKGYLPFTINTSEQRQETYTLHYEAEIGFKVDETRTPSENVEIRANATEQLLAIQDVPAFRDEPNIDCKENYIQSIEFELSSIKYPNDIRKDYTQSWESVNKTMIDHEDFGKLLNSNGFIEDTVAKLCKGVESKADKAALIYNYVQHRMKWNGIYDLFAVDGLKKPFKVQSGNTCEINLLLTLMLKTAGLNADPVMISTRSNGVAVSYYPTITKYNSIISKVEIDGTDYLLDASSRLCPFGILPARDINGQGRTVNAQNGSIIDLETKVKHATLKIASLAIQPDGKMTGSMQGRYSGYAGVEYRDALSNTKNEEEYIRKMQELDPGLVVNSFVYKDKNDIYKPLSDSLIVEISDKADVLGDKIIFKPLLNDAITKNRYTLEERSYPVNYNYPISESYMYEFAIPEGYTVESVPTNANIKLPDGSITLLYSIQVDNNKIRLIYKRNINKSLFLPDEYPALKEFYNMIVKKHNEQIILKKV